MLALDLSAGNPRLHGFDAADPAAFGDWLAAEQAQAGCDWALGGYGEDRALYAMSPLFDGPPGSPPRRVHLGLDLWLPAGTPVQAILAGRVHSLGHNASFGDYGPTVILEHRWQGAPLWALYGHLDPAVLGSLRVGMPVARGAAFAALGAPADNVGWAPHLHLQLIREIGEARGDYPGVASRAQPPAVRTCRRVRADATRARVREGVVMAFGRSATL